MYDDIKYEMGCPNCGNKVDDFQSKDGPCILTTLEFWEVSNFYASCLNCGHWIEFNRKAPIKPVPLEDYEMTVR